MWVPGSMAFLIPAGIIAMNCLSSRRRVRPAPPPSPVRRLGPRKPFDVLRIPVLGKHLRGKWLRPLLQMVVFCLAAMIVLDGLFGPQVSPVNLAGVMPWLHWSAFSAFALLVVGNLFCMVCPFTFARDLGRRIFPAARTWPRALRSKWISVVVVAGFFWAYEFLDLWDSPWWTAWLIVFYFVAAILVDGIFKNASYCKYICPIGQFQFVISLVSPMEVRVREPDVCASCKTHDCIKGNESQRGCELLLYQPRKSGNMDCTFCLDCVKACPHDNVGILPVPLARDMIADPRRSSVGSFAQRPDLAALILVVVFGAFANMAAMVAPVSEMERAVARLVGPHLSGAVWLSVFLLVVGGLPLASAALCGWLSSRWSAESSVRIACGFAPALVPLGFAMWIAHTSFHLFSGVLTPWPIIQRIVRDLGWTATVPVWDLSVPTFSGLPGLQILILNAGVLCSLWIFWKKSRRISVRPLPVFLPWALLAAGLYLAGLWLIFQPISMPLPIPPP
jgi:ferredoxin